MDSDRVDILKWLDANYELDPIPFEHVRYAVQGGRLEVVVWVYERFPDLPAEEDDLLCLHKGFCHADVMMWLHENRGVQLDRRMLPAFVKHSDVGLLTAFLERLDGEQPTFSFREFDHACEHSSLKMVQYLAEQPDVWHERNFGSATGSGDISVAKWIHSLNRPCWPLGSSTVQNLVRRGEWEFLEDIAARGQLSDRFNSFWQIVASDWEKIEVEWTLDNCPDKITPANSLGPWTCRHGHSDIVRRLIALGYPQIFAKANLKRILHSTRDGSLVQEFLEHRPELPDYRIFQWTAKHNQLSLLKFLFSSRRDGLQSEEGMSVDFDKSVQLVVTTASKYGHLGLLKRVQMHLNTISRVLLIDPWMGARHGHVHILEWLHDSGVMNESKLRAAMQASVQTGQLDALKWYEGIDREYRFSLDELQHALRRRDIEVVEWVVRKQPELRFKDAAPSLELEPFVEKWSSLAEDLAEAA